MPGWRAIFEHFEVHEILGKPAGSVQPKAQDITVFVASHPSEPISEQQNTILFNLKIIIIKKIKNKKKIIKKIKIIKKNKNNNNSNNKINQNK